MKKKYIVLIMILSIGLIITGCTKDSKTKSKNSLIGKYELKEINTSSKTYTPESLKKELGRKISLKITDKEFIQTTTYYSTDNKSTNSVEKFTYDDNKLYDLEAGGDAFFSYKVVDDELIIKNLDSEEKKIFVKK